MSHDDHADPYYAEGDDNNFKPDKYKILLPKDSDTGKTFWKEIGILLMNPDGSGGKMYLHMFHEGYIIKPFNDDDKHRRKPK